MAEWTFERDILEHSDFTTEAYSIEYVGNGDSLKAARLAEWIVKNQPNIPSAAIRHVVDQNSSSESYEVLLEYINEKFPQWESKDIDDEPKPEQSLSKSILNLSISYNRLDFKTAAELYELLAAIQKLDSVSISMGNDNAV